MEFKDYYKILGVDEDASKSEIKSAYRKLARKYHPDVSKEEDAEDRFKDVSEAYEVLKDDEKRAEYDQLRKYGHTGDAGFEPPPGWESGASFSRGGFTGADSMDFSDFFESIFGGAGGGFRQQRGQGFAMKGEDMHHQISLFLEEAYNGCEKSLRLQTPQPGPDGRVRREERTLKVKIPAGVRDGQHIRLRGQGGAGIGGGPAGDLYLDVRIAPHPHFRLDGGDVYVTVPITPWEAALGASIQVPTMGGKAALKVPEGAKDGQKLRLRGKGMPGKKPGDQYVVLQVAMPPKQTERSKELFRELSEEVPFNPREHLGV